MSRPVLLALALAACKGGPDEGATLERLVSQVLEPSGLTEDEVVVHEVGHLTPGAELVPAFGEGADEPAAVDVPVPTTLYLVDRNAGAGWTHDVDWVFLDDDGEARLETFGSYPVVDGEGFVPEREPSVWGAPWEPVDPEDFDEDDELAVWDGATGAPRAAPAVDPCDPPKPKVVITIAGGTFQAVRHDEANWRRLLGDRGYQTISVVPDGRRAPTRAQILDAIRQAVALGELDELVIVYSGHGLRDGGAWGLGDTLDTITGVVTPADLIRALRGAGVDRLTIVSMSCHSGRLQGLPAALKAAGLKATDIVLQTSSRSEELAWIPLDNSGSAFGKALFGLVAATPPGEDVPWDGIEVGPLTTTTSVGVRKQTAGGDAAGALRARDRPGDVPRGSAPATPRGSTCSTPSTSTPPGTTAAR
jgi:hypothetical protein